MIELMHRLKIVHKIFIGILLFIFGGLISFELLGFPSKSSSEDIFVFLGLALLLGLLTGLILYIVFGLIICLSSKEHMNTLKKLRKTTYLGEQYKTNKQIIIASIVAMIAIGSLPFWTEIKESLQKVIGIIFMGALFAFVASIWQQIWIIITLKYDDGCYCSACGGSVPDNKIPLTGKYVRCPNCGVSLKR